ncbi:hypothetical protein N781_07730 [Pontibacillus halophilus JSM 076056 = DSM 19796]|uniref:Sporulation protein YunB n=1 Tax=Pontibacillus halophilus JSM 076056 = DSM 19796 TaxID=1385510 RepID=A0A0A5GCA5_9BACI|nr:sporulation protein YunB [Pontibacillus halophilus]KGX89644.1 hypothetical protein N781_07730 [Pontibacillus halophilus JSM 076056 = DSM 19796]
MGSFNKKPKSIGPPPAKQIFVVTLVFFILSTFGGIWVINQGIEPTLMSIAETRTKQFAREAINEAVNKRIAEDLGSDELIKIETDQNGKIVTIGWNTVVVNRVLRNTTFRVQNYLKRLETEGQGVSPDSSLDIEVDPEESNTIDGIEEDPTVARIPIGQATNISLLANLGPEVPVHFKVIGDVQSDFNYDMVEYGINGVMITLSIELEANVSIVIPFSTRTATVNTSIPVDFRIVNGVVPDFYNGNGTNGGITPSIPIQDSILP